MLGVICDVPDIKPALYSTTSTNGTNLHNIEMLACNRHFSAGLPLFLESSLPILSMTAPLLFTKVRNGEHQARSFTQNHIEEH